MFTPPDYVLWITFKVSDIQVSYIQWYHTVPQNGSRKLIRTGSSAGWCWFWYWCWCWWCGYGGCRCWSLSQTLEWSSDFHLQAILTHFLSPKFVLRTVVSKIYNALLISGSSWSFSKLSQRTSQWYTPPPLGVYSCVAGNILGETVSQAFLQVVWISLNIFCLKIFSLNIFEHLWLYIFFIDTLLQINTATMATIASPLLIMVLVNLVSLPTTSNKILLLTLIAIVNTAVKWQMAKGENQGSQWSDEKNALSYAWNFGNYPLTTQFQQSFLIPMNENPSLV